MRLSSNYKEQFNCGALSGEDLGCHNEYPEIVEYMGRDEQESGALFVRLFSPTDLDKASEAIRKDLKDKLSFVDEFKYLGLFGGPVTDFLKNYIDTSHRLRLAYSTLNKNQIYSAMQTIYGYDAEALNIYFGALSKLWDQGKIPEAIYVPFTYAPDDSTIPEVASKYLVKSLIIGGVAYLLIKTVIFSGPELIGKYTTPANYKKWKRAGGRLKYQGKYTYAR